jgi:hypothetical protein
MLLSYDSDIVSHLKILSKTIPDLYTTKFRVNNQLLIKLKKTIVILVKLYYTN